MTQKHPHFATHQNLTSFQKAKPGKVGLYDPQFEHDACGVGFVCHIKGQASHSIIEQGIEILDNLDHRGAVGCDPNTGDGAGILVSLPDKFLRRECWDKLRLELPPKGQYAAGMMFLPADEKHRKTHELLFEKLVNDYDMVILGWRNVPVNSEVLGEISGACEPFVRQVFVGMRQSFYNKQDFERRLYIVRQLMENQSEQLDLQGHEDFYICALSTNRMIYKGMLTTGQLAEYYPDLSDPDFESHLALVHSRFSTNTFPAWSLSHPYRYIAHNGEINTLRGNRNWMRARQGSLVSHVFGDELQKLTPILSEEVSDSASLDSALQFLVLNGRPLAHGILMLIPEAWSQHQQMDPELKAFYEYHACKMEPWDGPAAIAFTNGEEIGAVLDRNGLRPARYIETTDDLVIMASEVGVLPISPDRIKRKWRLQPGKIFLVDTKEGRIVRDKELKQEFVDSRPWSKWISDNLIHLHQLEEHPEHVQRPDHETIFERQQVFGYTIEELKVLFTPMATTGKEGIGSMGSDTPLACLSDRPQPLFNYFRQLFAQVTNPPLDAIREELVTSLVTYLGSEGNLIDEDPKSCRQVRLESPIITNNELERLRHINRPGLKAHTVSTLYSVADGVKGFKTALQRLFSDSSQAVKQGVNLLVISDRGINSGQAALPSLLATSALHHHLIREGTRTQVGLIVETGEAREPHHFCLLIGYGAGAVNPYLAFETIEDMHNTKMLPADLKIEKALKNYTKSIDLGLLKVASKIGISTIQSYRGAQIFEAIGISPEVIDEYFTGTASRIAGITLETIEMECRLRHQTAYPSVNHTRGGMLDSGGNYQWRADGEHHAWNPDSIADLQQSVRINSYETYKLFAERINNENKRYCTLRGIMQLQPTRLPVPIEEVESAKDIVRRFCTGAMSLGSLSEESHETLAIAMNRIGGKSNTGEGGEDIRRYQPDENGDQRRSSIKQIASGRFGVTTEYLVNADELQIKMAQGAKPGEGGQLPGHKVSEYIAAVRHSTPGVGLISPPPHHDIYSIEDLGQLIHDLKNVNPKARISVKLVSGVGVGTIAAGVAKAKADHILISGDGGGTGASPLTSIKYCGIPWELGLAEAQQVLVMNDLRSRITLQVDGSMKTGRDVVIGALLGAEEFGFSTAPLIALGCIMMRVCHLNTCPVGIATQDPVLRAKFKGTPEHIINYLFFVAEEVREYMAELGYRTIEEMIGQVQNIAFEAPANHWKAKNLDFSQILYKPEVPSTVGLFKKTDQYHGLDKALDNELIRLATPAIEKGNTVTAQVSIRNINRSVGAMLSGTIAQKYGFAGLPEGTITFNFTGTAGQSFGAFLTKGTTFNLVGDVNDYLGKGICGGIISVRPPEVEGYLAENNIIAGNTICYGAISGEVYLRGVVGERFCVRNSGVIAVVEGVGDHGCEYMTGGKVLVLGKTGRNFAAGMSGGVAFIHDPNEQFTSLCNMEMVGLETPDSHDLATIETMLKNHVKYTGSPVAQRALNDFEAFTQNIVKVMPQDYKRVLEERRAKPLVTADEKSAVLT
ncbi:MAG: glutamate synthase large subunit [Sumerlaeia bacterium]